MTTDTEIIILAQGTQARMGGRGVGWKQLLPLPLCNGVPILVRTLVQLQGFLKSMSITVVTWDALFRDADMTHGAREPWRDVVSGKIDPATLRHVELADPGNSSLKGIARYLEDSAYDRGAESTIVLLGDVVYSWACLASLRVIADRGGFVGTSNLSSSGGEIWGIAWHRSREDIMLADLRDALLRHPPFDDTYQPGQLRRWLVGWRRGDVTDHVVRLQRTGDYLCVDDYTMDVDLPTHIPLLEAASRAAAYDDEQHDVLWGST